MATRRSRQFSVHSYRVALLRLPVQQASALGQDGTHITGPLSHGQPKIELSFEPRINGPVIAESMDTMWIGNPYLRPSTMIM